MVKVKVEAKTLAKWGHTEPPRMLSSPVCAVSPISSPTPGGGWLQFCSTEKEPESRVKGSS
jgi:hypothetical protein